MNFNQNNHVYFLKSYVYKNFLTILLLLNYNPESPLIPMICEKFFDEPYLSFFLFLIWKWDASNHC